jgi:hypothetical protein
VIGPAGKFCAVAPAAAPASAAATIHRFICILLV